MIFNKIRTALKSTYGRCEDRDSLMACSIGKETEDFMDRLRKIERILAAG